MQDKSSRFMRSRKYCKSYKFCRAPRDRDQLMGSSSGLVLRKRTGMPSAGHSGGGLNRAPRLRGELLGRNTSDVLTERLARWETAGRKAVRPTNGASAVPRGTGDPPRPLCRDKMQRVQLVLASQATQREISPSPFAGNLEHRIECFPR